MSLAALQPLWANKVVRYVLVAAALAIAGLAYRAHLIDRGATQERIAAAQRQADAVAQARQDEQRVTARVTSDLNQQLRTQQESHDRTTSDLQAALADSGLRLRRADERIVRLLNDAAGAVRAGTPPSPGRAGRAPGTPAGHPADPGPSAVASDADIIQSVNENYAICNRNSSRLAALQEWYEALRSRR